VIEEADRNGPPPLNHKEMVFMQIDREPAIRAAFDALRDIVTTFTAEGRPTVAASLKSALQRRFDNNFDQRSIGFYSFRDFLREAEARGVVELRDARGGDLEAVLPGATQSAEKGQEKSGSAALLRGDFWKAFLDWKVGWRRVYDVQEDRALMFPETATPFDRADWSLYREAVLRQPERFRSIDPIGMETQLEWMRAFQRDIDDPASKTLLQSALESSRPFGTFARLVNNLPEIRARWHRYRLDRVAAVASSWAQRNYLTIEFLQSPQPKISAPAKTATESGEGAVRARIHAIIDRMTLSDLLRLEIPISYLLD
jgi:Uncharacterised protein family (UPF0158)